MRTTLLKTLSYRLLSTSVTMSLAYGMTGSAKIAASLGLTNLLVNTSVYFGFETAWGRLVPVPA